MPTVNNQRALLIGDHKDNPNEVVTFAATATHLYGLIYARATSTGKLIPYVKGGVADGNGVPVAVLLMDSISRVGAGDVNGVLVLIQGEVRKEQLIIFADGNSSNVDDAVIRLLKAAGIIVTKTVDHSGVNNF